MPFISYTRDERDREVYSIDKTDLIIVELPVIEGTVIPIDKIKQQFKKILSLDAHPGHIATGFAVGVFVSFTPFFGLHTPLVIALAFIFRLNKLTCITGAWVNTPLTVVPTLVASYNLGRFLLGKPHREIVFKTLEWHQLQPYAKSILLGSSIIGFVCRGGVILHLLLAGNVFQTQGRCPEGDDAGNGRSWRRTGLG